MPMQPQSSNARSYHRSTMHRYRGEQGKRYHGLQGEGNTRLRCRVSAKDRVRGRDNVTGKGSISGRERLQREC